VAPGNENNLRIRILGGKGGLDRRQEHPNPLHWPPFDQPTQVIARDGIASVAFIEVVVASSARSGRWVKLPA
jgi:hypothetical protein